MAGCWVSNSARVVSSGLVYKEPRCSIAWVFGASLFTSGVNIGLKSLLGFFSLETFYLIHSVVMKAEILYPVTRTYLK